MFEWTSATHTPKATEHPDTAMPMSFKVQKGDEVVAEVNLLGLVNRHKAVADLTLMWFVYMAGADVSGWAHIKVRVRARE